MAQAVAEVTDQVLPRLEPLRGGLSIIAGATSGTLLDVGILYLGMESGSSSPLLPALAATAEAIVGVWFMDYVGDYMRGDNSLLFSIGMVSNMATVRSYSQSLAMTLAGKV